MEFKFEIGDKIGSVWGIGEITKITNSSRSNFYAYFNLDNGQLGSYSVTLIKTGNGTYRSPDYELPQIWPLDADGVNRYPREPEIDHEKEFWFGRRVIARREGEGWVKAVATGEISFYGLFVCTYCEPNGRHSVGKFEEVKYEDWADE